MAIPAELIAGPVTLYVADSGQSHPEISDAVPASPWARLGANINDGGVTFEHSEEITEYSPLHTAATTKLFRDREMLNLSLQIDDLSAEVWARIANGVAVSTQAAGSGTGGYREFTVGAGLTLRYYSLLIRGTSPEDNAMNLQALAPQAYISWSGGPTFVKGEPAGLELSIMLVHDTTIGGYMSVREQNVVASP